MAQIIQVQTALPDEASARRFAQGLLDERLAACVQIVGPISSMYHWQGKLESSAEWLCLAKTDMALFATIEDRLADWHPYECPELIATPIVAANAAYVAWLQEAVAAALARVSDASTPGASAAARRGPR